MTTKTLTFIFIGGILAMLVMRAILVTRSNGTTERQLDYYVDDSTEGTIPANFEQIEAEMNVTELPEVSESSTDDELLDALSSLDAEFTAAAPDSSDLSEIE